MKSALVQSFSSIFAEKIEENLLKVPFGSADDPKNSRLERSVNASEGLTSLFKGMTPAGADTVDRKSRLT